MGRTDPSRVRIGQQSVLELVKEDFSIFIVLYSCLTRGARIQVLMARESTWLCCPRYSTGSLASARGCFDGTPQRVNTPTTVSVIVIFSVIFVKIS